MAKGWVGLFTHWSFEQVKDDLEFCELSKVRSLDHKAPPDLPKRSPCRPGAIPCMLTSPATNTNMALRHGKNSQQHVKYEYFMHEIQFCKVFNHILIFLQSPNPFRWHHSSTETCHSPESFSCGHIISECTQTPCVTTPGSHRHVPFTMGGTLTPPLPKKNYANLCVPCEIAFLWTSTFVKGDAEPHLRVRITPGKTESPSSSPILDPLEIPARINDGQVQ